MKSFYLDSDIEEIYQNLQKHRNLIDHKSFLIVGGNGFLGKYFQAVLSKFTDIKITVIDQTVPQMRLLNVEYLQIDIVKEKLTNYLKHQKYDYVIAAASIASPRVYKEKPVETLDVGYIGLKNCLEKTLSDEAKVLFFSSSEVYGTANVIPTNEKYVGSIPTDNERSCYDLSKLIGSCLVQSYVKQHGLNASIVLPFNYYAPQIPDGRVMPSFMEKIVNNQPVEVFDGGDHKRTYCYATDGITGCLLVLLLGKNGEKYNIGNTNDLISVKDLTNKIENVLGFQILKKLQDSPKDYAGQGNPLTRQPDTSKAYQELGYIAKVSLDEGIKRFYNWAKENYKK